MNLLEPITTLSTNAPVTQKLLRTMLGEVATDQGTADQIDHVISAAWSACQNFIGRELRHGSYNEYTMRNDDGSVFYSVVQPILTVNSISCRNPANDGWIAFTGAQLAALEIVRLDTKVVTWLEFPAPMRITYTAGYRDDEWPGDIVQAVLITALAWYHARGRNVTVESENVDSVFGQTFRPEGIPTEARQLLAHYRLVT